MVPACFFIPEQIRDEEPGGELGESLTATIISSSVVRATKLASIAEANKSFLLKLKKTEKLVDHVIDHKQQPECFRPETVFVINHGCRPYHADGLSGRGPRRFV